MVKAWKDGQSTIHSGEVLAQSGDFDVIRCEQCAFAHAVPIPTAEALAHIYRHEYYTKEKPLYIERYLEDREWWNQVYERRFELFEGLLTHERRRILDVGSGPGLFLAHGRDRGWHTKGLEPAQAAVAYSRATLNLDIDEAVLDVATAARLGRFDVVNMGEVLEHLPDPVEVLNIAGTLIEGGGLICVIVPNDFNPFQKILSERLGFPQWWVAPPHHINYFDFDSLSVLIRRCGFDIVHVEATFPIDMFLLMNQNYVGNDEVGRWCHGLRKSFEMNIAHEKQLYNKLYTTLAQVGIGREVVMIARKP